MTGNGYLDSKRPNPLGMGLVVAAHGAVLTALILAPPEAVKRIVYVPLEAINIRDTPPPEPLPPEPQPQPKVDSQVDRVPPLVPPVPIPALPPVAFDPAPPQPLPQPLPPQPRAEPKLQPKAEPVLVDARPDPRYASDFQPDYPPSMARAEMEGKVTVRVLIGTDGRVKAVELVSATDPAFFQATERQALRRWRFRPATRDGAAVEAWRVMTVRFEMPN